MTALSHVEPPAVRGRRRESSRHRTSRSPGLPGWVAWTFRSGTPLVSLLPALLAVIVVQSLSPATQQLPTGQARFAVGGSWALSAPGAVVGYGHWFTTPVLGWLQIGVLERVLLGGTAQPVLAAAHGAMLLTTVAAVALLWFALRRARLSGLAAGGAVAAFGIAPIAVATHGVVAPVDVALVWLLVALLLALGPPGTASAVALGATAGAAVLTAPLALLAVPPLAWALVRPPDRRERTLRELGAPPAGPATPPILAAGAGFAVALILWAVAALLLSSGTPGAAGRAANAIGAAAGGPTVSAGAASAVAWLRADPLSLLIGLVAVILASRSWRFRPVTLTAVLVALAAFWPAGRDAAGPIGLLLPIFAFATAVLIDRSVVALGAPRFLTSAIGSGWLMAVVALLVVAVVVWAAALPALVPPPRLPLARAEAWVRASVPAGQVVLVDLATWPDLAHGARADVGWYAGADGPAPSSIPWPRTDYLLTAGGELTGVTGAARRVLTRSVPVARFGDGPDVVTVRAVRSPSAAGPAAPPATPAERRGAAARRRTGSELARNPRLTVDGADRVLLTTGAVDSRVAIVLAQLLATHRVTVGGFPVVTGEDASVRRQVLISAVDGHRVPADADATGTVLRYLSALRGDYATSTIDATDAGVLATFAPDPTFVPSS